ncbi:IS110 family transposase [Antarcticibacterium sp. 1MA-6-2]|uniref:IS110 family transposase n=2 Tax=Antarcticibacterium sp. 1MA-6-2 TaxID=2908210 RepID=UPI001F28078E|nr:IS110 family transposase [Antarcticibacterium sp. 1MA-6-2]UJH90048.1 IS110 family transposase [Antarcticibacterium sp. 1MA-6-2]
MKKLVVGIDISMNDFHACIKLRTENDVIKIKGTRTFENTEKGFQEFYSWALKQQKNNYSLKFVMEATGIYYENLAYFLYANDQNVSVVLANKIKNYAKSLNIKTKTDKGDSKMITYFGIERKLEEWQPMSPGYKDLRDLCRELLSIKKEKQRAQSQLHALEKSHRKLEVVLKLKREQIEFFEKAIKLIKKDIKAKVNQDVVLKEKIRKIKTTPGLGFETAVILVCETNGFALFNNISQLVSYAGLDVTQNESGKYKGKTRISKRGNTRIRQALYMPSMSAVQANEPIKKLYERVKERNPDIKRKGIVAGMRKLLILAYTLWKKDEEYRKDYDWTQSKKENKSINQIPKKAEPKAPH